jgi:Ciliary rootlet component, centrosome cohesion
LDVCGVALNVPFFTQTFSHAVLGLVMWFRQQFSFHFHTVDFHCHRDLRINPLNNKLTTTNRKSFVFVSIKLISSGSQIVMKRVTFKVSEALFLLLILFWFSVKFIFNRLFQLPNKEPTSLTSRIGDGGGLSLDKKKPFSRPFAKAPSGSAVRMSSPTPQESSALLRQNHELRQRLQEESSSYRRRLDTYKQAQSNQSALVSRLQAKVLQYKQRCSELEIQMSDTIPICPQYSEPSKTLIGTSSTPLPSICPKTTYSTAAAPMSLPVCTTGDLKPGNYCSDESDESFERKRNDDERKL